MPTARSATAAASVGGTVYVLGGYQGGAGVCQYLNRNEAYDTVSNSWAVKAPMPWSPDGPGAAAINGIVYAVGGLTNCGGAYSTLGAYDPLSNSWTVKAPMPAARGRLGVAALGGILYAVGGSTGSQVVGTMHAYDPSTNTWTTKAPMPTSRMWHAVAALNGLLYAAGGWSGSAGVATLEAYDPATNSWSTKAPMPTARPGLALVARNGLLYAIAGEYTIPASSLVEIYNPVTNQWTTGPAMLAARGSPSGAVADNRIYAFGGGGSNYSVTAATEAFGAGAADPVLAVDRASVNFAGQSMGTTSPPQSLRLTNAGGGNLVISGVTIAAQFAQTNDCGTLGPGASCTINVTFTPSALPIPLNGTSTVSGALAVSSNSAEGAGSVALSGVAEKSLVTHYYRSVLSRAPDAGGKAYWEGEALRLLSLGADVSEAWFVLASSFFNSPEYVAANRSDAAFVTNLYLTFFNRSPDPGGLAHWVSQIQAGLAREVVILSFLFSPEFATFTRNIFGDTRARAEVDVVMDFYRGILGRFPDSGGLGHWVSGMRAAQCQGSAAVLARVDDISSAFISSGEYASRSRTNSQFVSDMYNAFLRRGGDRGGVDFWIARLASGALDRNKLRAEFMASPEFGARVSAIIAQGCGPVEQAGMVMANPNGVLGLPSGANVSIAAGTLPASAPVNVASFLPARAIDEGYLDSTAAYEVGPPWNLYVLNTFASAPQLAMTLDIPVAIEYSASLPQGHRPHLFAKAFSENPDATLDIFIPIPSTFDPATGRLAASLPTWACSTRGRGYPWECIVAVGSLPAITGAAGPGSAAAVAGCTTEFYSPVQGGDPAALSYSSLFGERVKPNSNPPVMENHPGVDLRMNDGTPLVAVGNGYVSEIICSSSYGQRVVITLNDGTKVAYSHLKYNSINLKDYQGNAVTYHTCGPHSNPTPPRTVFPPGLVQVTGGITVLAESNNSGVSTGPHLHLEKLKIAGGTQFADPKPCITKPAPVDSAICYQRYNQCVAPCPVGGIAGIQCVNACLGELNRCLGI